MKPWLRAVAGGLVWALCCKDALAIKLPAPPTISELAGTWTGPDESGAVLRLKINERGAGSLEVRARGRRSRVERFQLVVSAQEHSYRLVFAMLVDHAVPRALTLSGSVMPGGNALSLTERFEGDDGLGLKALLVRKSDLVTGLQALGE